MITSSKSFLHTQGEHSLPVDLFLNTNQRGQLLVVVIVCAMLYSDTAAAIYIKGRGAMHELSRVGLTI